eukprot:753692-Hanusia_phi.AAC.3
MAKTVPQLPLLDRPRDQSGEEQRLVQGGAVVRNCYQRRAARTGADQLCEAFMVLDFDLIEDVHKRIKNLTSIALTREKSEASPGEFRALGFFGAVEASLNEDILVRVGSSLFCTRQPTRGLREEIWEETSPARVLGNPNCKGANADDMDMWAMARHRTSHAAFILGHLYVTNPSDAGW